MPHLVTQILSLKSSTPYTTQQIESLLNIEQTQLEHGATFTGRPDHADSL